MWYDEEAKKLYTIGLIKNVSPENIRQVEKGLLILNYLDQIRQLTGDDLCLDSAAIGKRTTHLQLMKLLTLFGMLLTFASF